MREILNSNAFLNLKNKKRRRKMVNKLKKIGIVLIVILIMLVLFFLIYSAVLAFNREVIELGDCDYISADNDIKMWIRSDYAIFVTPEIRTSYKVKVIDNDILELSKDDSTIEYAIFIDSGDMLYLKSMRIYLMKE